MTTPGPPDPTPRSATLLESVDHTRSSLLDAIRTGIVAYAAVWVVTFLITGAALLAVVLEDDEGLEWSWALTAPGQAIAMSSHGTFDHTSIVDLDDEFDETMDEGLDEGDDFSEFEDGDEIPVPDEDVDADEFTFPDEDVDADGDGEFSDEEFDESMMGGEFKTSARFTAISLTILGLMITALWVASRRAERLQPTSSRRAVLAASAVTGTTFAVLTWAVAFAARVRIDGDFGHAGTLSILFYGSVLGTVVGLLARRPVARSRIVTRLPSALTTSVRGVMVYLAVFVILLVPTAAIYAIVEGEAEAILMFPLAILNAAVYGLTFGQLAGIELPGLPFGDISGSNFFWLFSEDMNSILFALVPLSIVALALTVAVLARRSAGRPRTSIDAFWLVVTFAGVGALLTAISAVTSSTSSFGGPFGGDATFSFSLAPVQWLFLVMAAWGVVTEIAICIVGRPLAAVVPDKILDRLAGT